MTIIILFFIIIITLIFPPSASAHAFGQLYILPIPLWLYLWGAGAALVISFLAIGFFTKQSTLSFPKFQLKPNHWLIFFTKVLSIFLFLLTILTGFASQSPIQNFAVNFFWIIFLLGFTYLSALLGNIWDIVNPWKIIISWFGQQKPLLAYPNKLGYIPSLIFYFLLIWLELLSSGLGVKPSSLSIILLFYSIITFLGSFIFGKEAWFKYGEFFSVFFGLISRLSPFAKKGSLLEEKADHPTLLLFIIFMLSSTAFDGFRSTIVYFRYFFSFNPIFLLLLSPLFFLSLYLIAIWLMKVLSKSSFSIKDLSLQFAFSLIPIALAYNIAHYFTLLFISGQSIIPQVSDPFNLGWNLFNTADYQINVGLISAGLAWHTEVAVIIIGHILAVFLAHLMALKIFPKRVALLSQIPMLFLMVLYTMTGLWILSQPLTLGG